MEPRNVLHACHRDAVQTGAAVWLSQAKLLDLRCAVALPGPTDELGALASGQVERRLPANPGVAAGSRLHEGGRLPTGTAVNAQLDRRDAPRASVGDAGG